MSVYYDKDLIKKIDIKLNKDIEYKPKVYFKIIITLLIIFISIFLIFKNKKIVLNRLKKINSRSSIIKNSEIEKINILEKTTDINLFFRTFKNFKCNNKEKERLEHDFIDRCFQSIDFKNKFELNKLNSNLFSHKSEMCLETIKYCKKLFKYCTDEYINVK